MQFRCAVEGTFVPIKLKAPVNINIELKDNGNGTVVPVVVSVDELTSIPDIIAENDPDKMRCANCGGRVEIVLNKGQEAGHKMMANKKEADVLDFLEKRFGGNSAGF